MMLRALQTSCIVFLTSLAFFTSQAYADISASISLSPENPIPNSQVTLTLTSYSFNTSVAMISWQIGGKIIKQGRGENNLTINTGNVGESTVVNVKAETADGASITQAITISPSSIVLIYEAPQSYVPPMYPGRSLPAEGAVVRVTAIPQMSEGGRILDPTTLSYSWYLDDELLQGVSGAGRQSANITLNPLQDSNDIKVVVYTPRENSATKTITVIPHSVMPVVYLYDSLFGSNFNQMIGKRFEATKDFIVSLEPFYVSTTATKNPTYSWFLDNLTSTPAGGRILAFHPAANSYGSKTMRIQVQGPNPIIQDEQIETNLVFDTRK